MLPAHTFEGASFCDLARHNPLQRPPIAVRHSITTTLLLSRRRRCIWGRRGTQLLQNLAVLHAHHRGQLVWRRVKQVVVQPPSFINPPQRGCCHINTNHPIQAVTPQPFPLHVRQPHAARPIKRKSASGSGTATYARGLTFVARSSHCCPYGAPFQRRAHVGSA